MWEDWHRCCDKAASVKKLLATLDEYERLTEDRALAMAFLGKAFEQCDIDEALKWREESA